MQQQAIGSDLASNKSAADERAEAAGVASPARTPLYDEHVNLGARMVEFGGWMMPVQYTKGIIEEHRAVRSGVGIFDTCHMGEFVARGHDAVRLLQTYTTNNVAALFTVQAQYTFICNDEGGVRDDSIVYNFGDHNYVVVNAAPLKADYAWLEELANRHSFDVALENQSDATGKLDVQGPQAAALVQTFTGIDLSTLKFYWAAFVSIAGVPA